jgi:hypothetical protein
MLWRLLWLANPASCLENLPGTSSWCCSTPTRCNTYSNPLRAGSALFLPPPRPAHVARSSLPSRFLLDGDEFFASPVAIILPLGPFLSFYVQSAVACYTRCSRLSTLSFLCCSCSRCCSHCCAGLLGQLGVPSGSRSSAEAMAAWAKLNFEVS